jgi:HTH-type transcriptional regulator, sugar sensing transcriptional regulator
MNKFIEDLITTGLSLNQAKAYFYLLTNPEVTATELAKISKIPRARVYDVLEYLIKKGFCSEINDRVKRFKAVRPAEALGILDQELAAKREILLKLTDTLDKLYLLENRQEDPLNFIEVISDRSRQIERIEFLDDLVRYELFSMCKAPFDRNFLTDSQLLLQRFRNKDIKFRFLFELKQQDRKKLMPPLRQLSLSGAEVGIADFLPFKMNIYDSSKISFYKVESALSKTEPVLMIMKDNTLVKLFKTVFNKYFETAELI